MTASSAIRRAIADLTMLLSNRALDAIVEGATALERGDRRQGAKLIRRHAGELRRLSNYKREAVETLLAAAVP